MFITFFDLLKQRGLKISIHEWLSLSEALDSGLCGPRLTDFYYLCRCLLIKSETDFDTFDLCFSAFFKDVQISDTIPQAVYRWLDKEVKEEALSEEGDFEKSTPRQSKSLEKLQRMLMERLEKQKEEHHGGSNWIGTDGSSEWGHSGYPPEGIRVGGGAAGCGRALQVAGERHFRDFRRDDILDSRQFQMAFRKLRQHSSRVDTARTELDMDQTIKKTSDNAGYLKLVFEKPRQNTIKLLLLFDSDGSMSRYSRLCSELFHAVSKSSHLKDVKIYYFHNCMYDHLYTDPYCSRKRWIDTDWVFRNLNSEYRLIIVGDASMNYSELLSKGGNTFGIYNEIPGLTWLQDFRTRYPKHIWLNPIPQRRWERALGAFTIRIVKDIFPMYELTIDGLETGIKRLLVSR